MADEVERARGAPVIVMSHAYFKTRGIPMRAGQDFATLTASAPVRWGGWLRMIMIALHLLVGVISFPVFIGVPAILLLVAALASWLPARRATSVDVMVALRQE